MTDAALRTNRGRLRRSGGAGHPISRSPRTLALAGRELGCLCDPSLSARPDADHRGDRTAGADHRAGRDPRHPRGPVRRGPAGGARRL